MEFSLWDRIVEKSKEPQVSKPNPVVSSTSSPCVALHHAQYKLGGKRFPEGEEVMAEDAYVSLRYASDILKERFPEGESVISQSPHHAVEYAVRVIRGRFPEAEPFISRNYLNSYRYAKDVVKGRWEEGENAISEYASTSCRYAVFLGERFYKGEPAVLTDKTMIPWYARDVIKGRWEEGEKVLLDKNITKSAMEYLEHVVKGRWVELEERIVNEVGRCRKYVEIIEKLAR